MANEPNDPIKPNKPALEGAWLDPFLGDASQTLLSPDLQEALRSQIQSQSGANREMQRLLQEGWRRQPEVANEADISHSALNARTTSIELDGDYLPNAQRPSGEAGETIVKGSQLWWQHPNDQRMILLSPGYAQGIINAQVEQRRLESQGYRWQYEVGTNGNIEPGTLATRTRTLNPDADYLPSGQPPTGKLGEITVKGSQLRWQHPYDSAKVLLSPAYAQAFIDAEKEKDQLEEQGYQSQTRSADIVGINLNALYQRTALIEPNGDYLPDGQKPKGTEGEATVKGAHLKWQHPYNQTIILLAPSYLEGMRQAEEARRHLEEQNYVLQPEVASLLQMNGFTLSARTKNLDPNANYLPNGQLPTDKAGESTVKGSLLRWRHPYTQDTVLLAPSYVEGMLAAQEQQKLLEQQGYQRQATLSETLHYKGSSLSNLTRNIDPQGDYLPNGRIPTGAAGEATIKGTQLRWQHPYDNRIVLLSPQYAEGLKQADEQQRQLAGQGYQQQHLIAEKAKIGILTLARRTRVIEADNDYLQDGRKPNADDQAPPVKGASLRWQHPYDINIVLLSPAFAQGVVEAEEQYRALLAQNYRQQCDVADQAGIRRLTLAPRTRNIKPEESYLPDGREPEGKPGETVVKGATIRWQHPYDIGRVLLSPELAKATIIAEEEQKKLEAQGYQLQSKVAKMIDSTVKLSNRTRNIDPQKDYLPDGELPLGTPGEITFKGSQLKWEHPYDHATVLLHPDYTKAFIEVDEKYRRLKEQNYKLQFDVAKEAQLSSSSLSMRTKNIMDNDNYLPNGQKAPPGTPIEETVKGSELRWRHPYNSNIVLFAPAYAQAITKSKDRLESLQGQGYLSQPEVAILAQVSSKTLSALTSKIDPEGDYLPDGRMPTGGDGEVTVKGSDLRWQSPDDLKVVFLAPSYAAGIIQAEKRQLELMAQGYRPQHEVGREAGIERSTLSAKAKKIVPDADYQTNGLKPTGVAGEEVVKGSQLRWQHPYDQHTILLSPAFSQGLIAAQRRQHHLESQGYRLQADVATEGKVHRLTLSQRTREINSSDNYYTNGSKVTPGTTSSPMVLGSDVRWQHPYSKDVILLHPDYAAALVAELSPEKQRNVVKGATAKKVGNVAVPPAELAQELAEQDRDDKQRGAV